MSKLIGPEMRVLLLWMMTLFAGSYALSADGEVVTGEVIIAPAGKLSEQARLEVALVDVSRADAHAEILAQTVLPLSGKAKQHFELKYDPKEIDPRNTYAVQAFVKDGGRLAFVSTEAHHVLTNGFPEAVAIPLKSLGGQKVAAAGGGVFGGTWLVEDIDGRGVIDRARTTIGFEPSGRVFGSGGCNNFQGNAEISGAGVKFGPLAVTRKMCPRALMDQETRFFKALENAVRYEIDGAFLRMFDREGKAIIRATRL
ncbi:MAG: META domain-containing protein [Hyphomicrobiales bacterium]